MEPKRFPRFSIYFYYCACLLLSVFLFNLLSPVFAGDFDVWYHLNAGRYIWQHGAVPHQAFFSFLTPPRPWADYYWMFQAIVYAVYHVAGYYGLVAMRAGLLAGTLLLAQIVLFRENFWRPSPVATALFALCVICLIPRFLLVRPHLFSYFFLALTVYVLEVRPDRVHFLPVVAVLWGNIHGVYYPVFALACGAYAAECYLRRRAAVGTERERRTIVFVSLSIAAFFLTPLGLRLVAVPFASMDYAARHVKELMPFEFSSLLSAKMLFWAPDHETTFNLLFYAAFLAALTGVGASKIRPSHLLLFGGGFFLLTRGRRFEYECALLALPLLSSSPLLKPGGLRSPLPKHAHVAAVAALMAVPFCVIKSTAASRPQHYPLSFHHVPHGVTTFLNKIDAGGSVYNYPNVGGYLEWALHPKYKIAADMQTPFLFTDDDQYLIEQAFIKPELMELLVARYSPDFIVAPIHNSSTKNVLSRWSPRYVPVFFDDMAVLYADSAKHPDVARLYALPVDPYNLPELAGVAAVPQAPADCALPPYLTRMIGIESRVFVVQAYAAQICRTRKAFDGELAHARILIENFPEEPEGYLLEGNALRELGDLPGAMTALRYGLGRADSDQKRIFQKEIAEIFAARKQYVQAVAWNRDADNSLPPLSWPRTKQDYLHEISPIGKPLLPQ